jgi:hypothetical protein
MGILVTSTLLKNSAIAINRVNADKSGIKDTSKISASNIKVFNLLNPLY